MGTRIASSAAVSELLDINNYLVWSVEVETYLEAQDLWKIDETTENRSIPENEAAFNSWTRRNAMALHVIRVSCNSSIGFVLRLITTAKLAWDTLELLCKIPQSDYEGISLSLSLSKLHMPRLFRVKWV